MRVAALTHSIKFSPFGPAEQLAGGSMLISASSFWMRFLLWSFELNFFFLATAFTLSFAFFSFFSFLFSFLSFFACFSSAFEAPPPTSAPAPPPAPAPASISAADELSIPIAGSR